LNRRKLAGSPEIPVEVLEPPDIRDAVMETAEAVREVYMKKHRK
jgi:hypothetical protein